jgi:hypothetical protein
MIPRTEESPNRTNDEANRYFEEAAARDYGGSGNVDVGENSSQGDGQVRSWNAQRSPRAVTNRTNAGPSPDVTLGMAAPWE